MKSDRLDKLSVKLTNQLAPHFLRAEFRDCERIILEALKAERVIEREKCAKYCEGLDDEMAEWLREYEDGN